MLSYDRIYMSKVFTFSLDNDTVMQADEIIKGGTGYRDYGSLPEEIEAMPPDYSIYPRYPYAVGFLTRGCIRSCPWCIVPQKEGGVRPAATWREIKRPDSRTIIFLDNNVLAHEHGLQQIEEMGHVEVKVDFNQGLDARLITPEIAGLLAKLHWVKYVRLSCDTSDMLPVIAQAVAYLREAGIGTHRLWSYMLVQDVEEAYHRALVLKALWVNPFAQPYRDYDNRCEPTEEQKQFARWVNRKEIFYTCGWHEYRQRK